MAGESMIANLYRLFGDEIQRGVSGGNVFNYRGLWDASGGTSYGPGDIVRYASTDEEDCGNGCWVALEQITYDNSEGGSFDAATMNPCVLSLGSGSPWLDAEENGPIEVAGPGDPNGQEGDDGGPIPLAPLSIYRSYTGGAGQAFIKDQSGDGWTAMIASAGGSVTLSATPPDSPSLGDIWVRFGSASDLDAYLPISSFAYRQAYVFADDGGVGVPGAEGWVALGQAFFDADGGLRGILTFSNGAVVLFCIDPSGPHIVSELALMADGNAQLFAWDTGTPTGGLSVEPLGIRYMHTPGGIGGISPFLMVAFHNVAIADVSLGEIPPGSFFTLYDDEAGTATLYFRFDGNSGDPTAACTQIAPAPIL